MTGNNSTKNLFKKALHTNTQYTSGVMYATGTHTHTCMMWPFVPLALINHLDTVGYVPGLRWGGGV